MGSHQAQYAPSMYIALWSRVAGFERAALTHALERREVVQGTLMRATIHLVSAADYWPLARAFASRSERRGSAVARRGLDEAEVAAAAERVRAGLADGPLRRRAIDALLGDKVLANGIDMWLDLVRIRPRVPGSAAAPTSTSSPSAGSGRRRRGWRRGASDSCCAISRATAPLRCPNRELGGAAGGRGDAYVRATRAAPPERRARRRAARSAGRALPDPETPAPVRFLPTWDASLLVHARRTGILPEEHRPKVFNTKTPQSVPTFLVDGRVAGAWRWERGAMRLEPFLRLDRATHTALEEEAEALAELHR
jgi:hypothetical protein